MMDFWLLVSCYYNDHPVLDWACKGHISAYSPQKICGPVSLRQPPQEVRGAPTCLGGCLCLFEASQLWADYVYVRTHSLSCALRIGSPKLHVNTRCNQVPHLPPSCKHSTFFLSSDKTLSVSVSHDRHLPWGALLCLPGLYFDRILCKSITCFRFQTWLTIKT